MSEAFVLGWLHGCVCLVNAISTFVFCSFFVRCSLFFILLFFIFSLLLGKWHLWENVNFTMISFPPWYSI